MKEFLLLPTNGALTPKNMKEEACSNRPRQKEHQLSVAIGSPKMMVTSSKLSQKNFSTQAPGVPSR